MTAVLASLELPTLQGSCLSHYQRFVARGIGALMYAEPIFWCMQIGILTWLVALVTIQLALTHHAVWKVQLSSLTRHYAYNEHYANVHHT